MSIAVMSWIWKNSPTSGSDRLILLAIADSANDEGVAWPSMETLAKKANLSRRYVIDILAKLEDEKHITIERRRDGPKNKSNIYTVLMVNHTSPSSEEGITRGSEASLTRVVNHTSPDPLINHKAESSNNNGAGALTLGQSYLLNRLGGKRLNPGQRDTVLELERTYGTDRLKEVIDWAADKGMAIGVAVPAIKKAIPKWGTNGSSNGRKPVPPPKRKQPEMTPQEIADQLRAGVQR